MIIPNESPQIDLGRVEVNMGGQQRTIYVFFDLTKPHLEQNQHLVESSILILKELFKKRFGKEISVSLPLIPQPFICLKLIGMLQG